MLPSFSLSLPVDSSKAQADFQKALEASHFNQEVRNGNVNEASNLLSATVAMVCDKHAPFRTFKPRQKNEYAPWFTLELIRLIEEKETALCSHRSLRTRSSKASLKSLTNRIKSLKRKLKKQHYASLIEQHKNNSKKLWELLKEATRTQTTDSNTEPDDMDKQKANTFNNFFATIGRKTLERLNLTEPAFTPTATHGFTFDPTTPSEIRETHRFDES